MAAWLTTVLCTGLVLGAADFDDSYRDYQIIYHHTHHLLVAIHNDSCFFVNVPSSEGYKLNHAQWNTPQLQQTEESLLSAIRGGNSTQTTLGVMREKYQADFHCLHKDIFEVDLFHLSDAGHQASCDGRPDGFYPYPPDCHQFVNCVLGIPFVTSCGPLTAFSPTKRACSYTGSNSCT